MLAILCRFFSFHWIRSTFPAVPLYINQGKPPLPKHVFSLSFLFSAKTLCSIKYPPVFLAVPLKMSIFAYINTPTDSLYGSHPSTVLRLCPFQGILWRQVPQTRPFQEAQHVLLGWHLLFCIRYLAQVPWWPERSVLIAQYCQHVRSVTKPSPRWRRYSS